MITLAIGFAKTQGSGDERKRQGEQTVARKLYAERSLEGAVVTADALHNSAPDARAILDAGADYILQVKQENRHSYRTAERIAQSNPLFSTSTNPTAPTGA